MEPNNNQIPRIIFLFSLIFFTAQGVCVPRNLMHSLGPSPQPNSPPQPSPSTTPISHISAPSGALSNPPESAPTLPPSPMPMKENLHPSTPPNYTPHQTPSSSPVDHITAPTPALNSPSESAPSSLQTQSDSPISHNSIPNPTSEPSNSKPPSSNQFSIPSSSQKTINPSSESSYSLSLQTDTLKTSPHNNPPSIPASMDSQKTINPSSESSNSLSLQTDIVKTSPHSNPPSIPASMDPAIKKICDSTDNPALCLSTLAPFLSGKTDPISVLEMAIKACTQHVKDAIATASVLTNVHKASTDSGNIPFFKDCTEMYNDALDNLQSAMDAIPARDIGTINTMLSAALSDFVTCEDEFSGETSELSPYDDKGTKMASNCLAIASLIK
ncbi:hypothetical protein ACB092_02G070500 [Castanea dentata]